MAREPEAQAPIEVAPGLIWWRSPHPDHGLLVDSYWLDNDGVLIDPVVPSDGGGLAWFSAKPKWPTSIVLTNRHHYRSSNAFIERFGCKPVHVPETGLDNFTAGQPVSGYSEGNVLPGGLEPITIGVLAPDDGALYLPALKAIWFADSLVRSSNSLGGPLGFVPDNLMDEPEQTKRGIVAAVNGILGRYAIEHVLMPHGGPVIGDGAEKLREVVDTGGFTISSW
jgi:hypothetical protein